MNKEIQEIAKIVIKELDKNTDGTFYTEEIATALHKAGYRKQSDVIKEFVVKAEQRFREDSEWLDIMLKCYVCKDSEDYDAVANAIIRGRFVNRLNDLAEQYGKEE